MENKRIVAISLIIAGVIVIIMIGSYFVVKHNDAKKPTECIPSSIPMGPYLDDGC
jgi:hypothetical protein